MGKSFHRPWKSRAHRTTISDKGREVYPNFTYFELTPTKAFLPTRAKDALPTDDVVDDAIETDATTH